MSAMVVIVSLIAIMGFYALTVILITALERIKSYDDWEEEDWDEDEERDPRRDP